MRRCNNEWPGVPLETHCSKYLKTDVWMESGLGPYQSWNGPERKKKKRVWGCGLLSKGGQGELTSLCHGPFMVCLTHLTQPMWESTLRSTCFSWDSLKCSNMGMIKHISQLISQRMITACVCCIHPWKNITYPPI